MSKLTLSTYDLLGTYFTYRFPLAFDPLGAGRSLGRRSVVRDWFWSSRRLHVPGYRWDASQGWIASYYLVLVSVCRGIRS
ncbi:MAG: hypothetical protein ACYDCX_00050 [Acidithiobacillus sp.]